MLNTGSPSRRLPLERLRRGADGAGDEFVVDRLHAAAIVEARCGEALLTVAPERARSSLRKALTDWEDIIRRSNDVQFKNEFAWFLGTAPDPGINDAARAATLVRTANRHTANVRAQLSAAAILAIAGEREAARKALDSLPVDVPGANASDYVRAMDASRRDNPQEAAECWRRAEQWRQKELPGEWLLLSLSRVAKPQSMTVAPEQGDDGE